MKILITGGAGCLGSNLVERLLPKGIEICVIDNFATGKREVLPEVSGLRVVEGSISDELLVNRCFEEFGPTHVIHSAAAYKDPENWQEDIRTNVLGSAHIARACERQGVRRLIHFQTALCYGRPDMVPIPITHPARPFTSYGISKTAGEQFLMMNAAVNTVSLRLANICGPRLAIGPIPTFYKRLKAGQSCFCSDTVRDFLDMQDFLDLVELLLESSQSGVFNVSTGVGHTIHQVFLAVCKHLEISPPDVPIVPAGADDVPSVVLDASYTKETLGWEARIDFESTIRRQLEWYDKYGVNDVYSHLKREE